MADKASDKVKVIRKKVQAVIQTVEPKTTWQKVKDWFYNSEAVVHAYIVSAIGVITGLVGALDLSPFWSLFQTGTTFTNKQLMWMGAGVVGAGVTAYIARIRGTREIDGHLVPKAT